MPIEQIELELVNPNSTKYNQCFPPLSKNIVVRIHNYQIVSTIVHHFGVNVNAIGKNTKQARSGEVGICEQRKNHANHISPHLLFYHLN